MQFLMTFLYQKCYTVRQFFFDQLANCRMPTFEVRTYGRVCGREREEREENTGEEEEKKPGSFVRWRRGRLRSNKLPLLLVLLFYSHQPPLFPPQPCPINKLPDALRSPPPPPPPLHQLFPSSSSPSGEYNNGDTAGIRIGRGAKNTVHTFWGWGCFSCSKKGRDSSARLVKDTGRREEDRWAEKKKKIGRRRRRKWEKDRSLAYPIFSLFSFSKNRQESGILPILSLPSKAFSFG